MQKKYISYWNHTLQHSQKLNFYYKTKMNSPPPPAPSLYCLPGSNKEESFWENIGEPENKQSQT